MYSAKGRQARGRGRQNIAKAERAEQQLMDMKVIPMKCLCAADLNFKLHLVV